MWVFVYLFVCLCKYVDLSVCVRAWCMCHMHACVPGVHVCVCVVSMCVREYIRQSVCITLSFN